LCLAHTAQNILSLRCNRKIIHYIRIPETSPSMQTVLFFYYFSVYSKYCITLQTGNNSAEQCFFVFFFFLDSFPFTLRVFLSFSSGIYSPAAFQPTLQLWAVQSFFITMPHRSFYVALLNTLSFTTPPNLVASINLITVLLSLIYRSLGKIKPDPTLVFKAHH